MIFRIINSRDERKINWYLHNAKWKKCSIIPFFRDCYICFVSGDIFSFDVMLGLFINGTEEEKIGAISVVAEYFPQDLLKSLNEHNNLFHYCDLDFLMKYVISDYLPLAIPREKLPSFHFNEELRENVWVRILEQVRNSLKAYYEVCNRPDIL